MCVLGREVGFEEDFVRVFGFRRLGRVGDGGDVMLLIFKRFVLVWCVRVIGIVNRLRRVFFFGGSEVVIYFGW